MEAGADPVQLPAMTTPQAMWECNGYKRAVASITNVLKNQFMTSSNLEPSWATTKFERNTAVGSVALNEGEKHQP